MKLPDLHRTEGVPEWGTVPHDEWNEYQSRAAATHGIDTPGNRETAKGLAAGLIGFEFIDHDTAISGAVGIACLAYGRSRDLKDGKRAHETETKSPLGEAFDAGTDTILMARALPVMQKTGILSSREIKDMKRIVGIKTIASGLAKVRGSELHASRTGKYATYLQWAGIGVRTTAHVAGKYNLGTIENKLTAIGKPIMQTGIYLGQLSTVGYTYAALRKPKSNRSK